MMDEQIANTLEIVPMTVVPNMVILRRDGELTEKRDLTPAQAADFLTHWQYRKQRIIRRLRVETYVQQMMSGDWTYRTELNVGVLPDGSCYLLNGYHRLTALTQVSDPTITLPVRVVYTLMEDEQDMANYYGVMDIGGTRSSRDAVRAQDLAEAWNVAPDLLVTAGAAAALIMTDFSGGRSHSWHSLVGRSIPARIRFLREWEAELVQANNIIKPAVKSVKKYFNRQAVVGVMLLTLRHAPDKAYEFWSAVVSGEGLYLGDPQMTLRNYLQATPTSKVHEHVYARYVANCWNAFYREQKMTRTQVKSEGVGDLIVIDGTPYSRGRRERERQKRIEAMKQRAAHARNSRRGAVQETEAEPEN